MLIIIYSYSADICLKNINLFSLGKENLNVVLKFSPENYLSTFRKNVYIYHFYII